MSNIGSTALSTAKQKSQTHPEGILDRTKRQNTFDRGTMDLLDEARKVVEGAVGQNQQINPLIYQLLGLQPTMTDNSQELQGAQSAYDTANTNLSNAKQTLATIESIPKGKRSKQQKQQFRQLKKQMPTLTDALGKTQEALGRIQTAGPSITGFTRMDPSQIDASSPFSSQNPLNQAQATEADRLNKYLAGGEVDPTLKHQYDAAEQSLRAKLAQRYGPDYENSSVGQMALQNFARQKNEAFATWNQQQVESYNNMAFKGASDLNQLLAQKIGLYREPSQATANIGNALGATAGPRTSEESVQNQWALGHGGVSSSGIGFNPAPMLGGALSGLFNTDVGGHTLPGWAGQGIKGAWNALTGPSNAGAAAGTAVTGDIGTGSAFSDAFG